MQSTIIFVVDNDRIFQEAIKSIFSSTNIDLRFYASSMEIFPLITREKPALIFLNLEVPDVNEFIMFDLLKKAESASSPVHITYSGSSENDLGKYQKLKYKAAGYYKKPLSDEIFNSICAGFIESGAMDSINDHDTLSEDHFLDMDSSDDEPELEIDEIDDDEFSDENIDKLIKGDSIPIEFDPSPIDSQPYTRRVDSDTNEILKVSPLGASETKDELIINIENAVAPKAQNMEDSREIKARKIDRELEAQVISLENQNEFLRTENKKLTVSQKEWSEQQKKLEANIQHLISDIEAKNLAYQELIKKTESDKEILTRKVEVLEKHTEQLEDHKSDLTRKLRDLEFQLDKLSDEKTDLQKQSEDLSNRLTDKERESVARNHKFEVELKKKLDEVLQEAEERWLNEYKQKENRISHDFQQLQNEKKEIELDLLNKLEDYSNSNNQLEVEKQELKKREENLNRAVSALAEEKVTIAEKLSLAQEQIQQKENDFERKESQYRKTLEDFANELTETRNRRDFYKKRIEEMTLLLQKALSLAENQSEN